MKNKFLYFLIVSLCMVSFASCSNDDEDSNIQFYSGSEKVTSIKVNNVDSVYLIVSNASGSYTVKSGNEDIATAVITEHQDLNTAQTILRVKIKGVKEGNTSITVTDSKNRSAVANVEVVIKTLSLAILRNGTNVETENQATEDQVAIDKIKAEITSKLPPVGGGFKLNYTTSNAGTLIYYPDIKKMEGKVEGTFKFERDVVLNKSFLKFNYNSAEYAYSMEGGNLTTGSALILMLDFITDYSQMTKPKITKASGALIINKGTF